MRPTMMFGPGDTLFRSTHLIVSFMERKIPIVAQGGLSFVDVRDVAKAFKVAMEIGKPGSSYLLGTINMSLDDLFKTLEELTQVPRPTQRLPYYAAWLAVSAVDKFNRRVRGQWNSGFDPVRVEMASHFWYISSEKAEKELGFSPIDPTKTLQDTITWIIQNKKLAQEYYTRSGSKNSPKVHRDKVESKSGLTLTEKKQTKDKSRDAISSSTKDKPSVRNVPRSKL